jgi:hypothetical protein
MKQIKDGSPLKGKKSSKRLLRVSTSKLFMGPGNWLVVPCQEIRRLRTRRVPIGCWWGFDENGSFYKFKASVTEIYAYRQGRLGGIDESKEALLGIHR